MNYTLEKKIWDLGVEKEAEIFRQIEWEHALIELGVEMIT